MKFKFSITKFVEAESLEEARKLFQEQLHTNQYFGDAYSWDKEVVADNLLGQEVDLPDPRHEDSWDYGFTGIVQGSRLDTDGTVLVVVVDSDGDVFDVPYELIKDQLNEGA